MNNIMFKVYKNMAGGAFRDEIINIYQRKFGNFQDTGIDLDRQLDIESEAFSIWKRFPEDILKASLKHTTTEQLVQDVVGYNSEEVLNILNWHADTIGRYMALRHVNDCGHWDAISILNVSASELFPGLPGNQDYFLSSLSQQWNVWYALGKYIVRDVTFQKTYESCNGYTNWPTWYYAEVFLPFIADTLKPNQQPLKILQDNIQKFWKFGSYAVRDQFSKIMNRNMELFAREFIEKRPFKHPFRELLGCYTAVDFGNIFDHLVLHLQNVYKVSSLTISDEESGEILNNHLRILYSDTINTDKVVSVLDRLIKFDGKTVDISEIEKFCENNFKKNCTQSFHGKRIETVVTKLFEEIEHDFEGKNNMVRDWLMPVLKERFGREQRILDKERNRHVRWL